MCHDSGSEGVAELSGRGLLASPARNGFVIAAVAIVTLWVTRPRGGSDLCLAARVRGAMDAFGMRWTCSGRGGRVRDAMDAFGPQWTRAGCDGSTVDGRMPDLKNLPTDRTFPRITNERCLLD